MTAAGFYERVPILDLDERHAAMIGVLIDGTANVCRSTCGGWCSVVDGAICTIGSELALCGDADAAHYAACKGAVHALQDARARGRTARCAGQLRRAGPDRHAVDDRRDARPGVHGLARPAAIGHAARDRGDGGVRAATPTSHNLVGQVVSPNAGAVV